jgi:hypothetical protein
MVVCQAQAHGLALASSDPLVRQYPVTLLWAGDLFVRVMKHQRKLLLFIPPVVAMLAVAAWVLWHTSRVPDGCYECSRLGGGGFAYLQFKDGQVQLVVEEEGRFGMGRYHRRENRWVWIRNDGSELIIRPSLFALVAEGELGEFGDPYSREEAYPRVLAP